MRFRVGIFLLFIILPFFARGSVIFSEIMYDFPGIEGGGEHDWVEVTNTGASSVDLSTYKFFEANTNHSLKLDRGSATLSPGGFAVIASATTTFLADWPNFSGTLFDSSFSLNSNGELLKLCSSSCSAEGSVVEDSLTYAPIDSATNNGDSLQKVDGSFIAALPTPGAGTSENNANTNTVTSTPTEINSGTASANNSSWPVEPQVFADAGKDKIAIVGATAVFSGKAYGLKKEPLENARFLWNFGDGTIGEGKIVEHTYRHPGDYLVVMEAASGYFSGQDQLKVRALPSPLAVSAITDGSEYFIELHNASNSDIDISSWGLALGDKIFEIPKNTFVMSGNHLVFGNETTGLTVVSGSVPELRYPNGTLAYRYGETKPNIQITPGNNTVAQAVESDISADVKNKTSVAAAESEQATPENMDAAATSAKSTRSNYIWFLGVGGISLIALAGIFLTRRYGEPEDEIEKLAREIEIIEE